MECTAMNKFSDFIAAKGLHMSHQRVLILDAFLSIGQPTSFDELYVGLRTRYPTIGRSTVNRTLKLLVECGIARLFVVSGAAVSYERVPFAEDEAPRI